MFLNLMEIVLQVMRKAPQIVTCVSQSVSIVLRARMHLVMQVAGLTRKACMYLAVAWNRSLVRQDGTASPVALDVNAMEHLNQHKIVAFVAKITNHEFPENTAS
jgi:hypothetical protein